MSRLTPELAKSRSRLAGHIAARHDPPPRGRQRIKAVPLASLSVPQRLLIGALLDAAKAADAKKVDDGRR